MPRFASHAPASFSIGELSRRTGVNIETIRYYERIQLLPPPPRTAGGRRVYGPAESRTINFIRRARALGFTLGEIRTLLALSAGDERRTCRQAREIAARHLADIRAKIADLHAMERVLAETVALCDTGQVPGCPVIETLSAE